MRRLFWMIGMAVLAVSLTVSAQQSGTLVLKSGASMGGELVDMGGSTVTFRVNGENREFPRGDVARIDFGDGDTPAAARDLAPGVSLFQLRNGEVFQGEFYDVQGAQPIRIVVRTGAGERTLQGPEVLRIYMTRTDTGASATPSSVGGPWSTVIVPARTAWTSTNLTVRRGQTVRFEATGEIVFSPRGHVAKPAGSVDGLFDSNAPVPSAPQGALVGRIGAARAVRGSGGTTFAIAGQSTVVMPADGVLFLGVNDSGVNDNRGEFTVRITPNP
jgi:hypothetical protein